MATAGTETPDEILVLGAIMGDLDAFGELAGRYRAAAVRSAQAIVGRDDAEDVAQDALILAFKALPSIEDPTKFAAWLGAITRHRALRFGQRDRNLRRVDLDEVLLAEVGALTLPLINESEAAEELQLALEKVPPEYALVLRLRFFDEMPLRHIAAFVGVPVSTVKWRVHKGKELLREQVESLRQGDIEWKREKK
ncbi:MAG: RNA polymerase sigma factor [Pyrinomonadaceae bacterium]